MDVSVVIPCYNAEEHIRATLDSVLAQTLRPVEVLVVDDGSGDRSREIAASYGSPVRVLDLDHGGAARARNRGAAEATGDAIMFLDSDDLLGAGALESLAAALDRRPGGFSVCPWYRLTWDGAGWVTGPPSCVPRAGRDPLRAWLDGWYHPPCSLLWSREGYGRTGGWDESLVVNQDGDLVLRALAADVPLTVSRRGAAFYRRARTEGRSVSGRRFTRPGLQSRMRVLEKLQHQLDASGRVRYHAGAMARAYDRIAADAAGRAPDLAAECTARAERLGGPRYRRRLRELGVMARIRLTGPVRRLRRVLTSVPAPTPNTAG